MKIILSDAWYKGIRIWFLIEVVCILINCISFRYDIALMIFLCLIIFAISTITQIIILCSEYRFFTYAIDTKESYKSYLLKKELCVVRKHEKIYYALFWAKETRFAKRRYIIISNSPFGYNEKETVRIFPWDKKSLLVSYDVRTQIAMPYNEKTSSYFELDNWICVN